ncbi:MAG: HAMP domain-containing sensor histidine kinase [Thermodesulfobacteriota bacterium]
MPRAEPEGVGSRGGDLRPAWPGLAGRWRSLRIAGKLAAAFGGLLALIVLVALTGFLLLRMVQRHIESDIVSSLEIQRLILEMGAGLERARQLEKDFFLRWPNAGFEAASRHSVERFLVEIDTVLRASSRVRELTPGAGGDGGWSQATVSLAFFLSAADRYRETFMEAVDLVALLAEEKSGLLARFAAGEEALLAGLGALGDPQLLFLCRDMVAAEKDYLLTRQRPFMQTAFNLSARLSRALESAPGGDPATRDRVQAGLRERRAVAEKILETDVEIRSRLAEFDLQAEAVDPLSRQLVELGSWEVNEAREAIARLTRLGAVALAGAVAAAVALAGAIAWMLNAGITRNLERLTRVAQELRRGNLDARAEVPGGDEVGQLAEAFNAMAAEIRQRTGDITAKARELEAVNRRLQELDTMKSDFVSSVSHELRTPLTSILGFAKILDRDFTRHFLHLGEGDERLAGKGETIRQNLRIIGEEGLRLTRLINQVLDLNKIESGRVEWRDAPVAPEMLVARAVDAVRGQFAELPGVDLRVEAPAGLPLVCVDPDRLVQVLINLLHNAAKFTSSGSVTVRSEARGGEVLFQVADTGRGIPAKALPTLFEKFRQCGGDENNGGAGVGAGLGLAICKQILEHYGREMRVESVPGRGSTFSFTLFAVGTGAG